MVQLATLLPSHSPRVPRLSAFLLGEIGRNLAKNQFCRLWKSWRNSTATPDLDLNRWQRPRLH